VYYLVHPCQHALRVCVLNHNAHCLRAPRKVQMYFTIVNGQTLLDALKSGEPCKGRDETNGVHAK